MSTTSHQEPRAKLVRLIDVHRVRRFRLLRFYLIALTLTALVFGAHNFTVDGFVARPFTLLLWVGAACGLFSIWRFYGRGDWRLPSYVLSIASGGVALGLIIVSDGLADAYAVALLPPLIAFPLLGFRPACAMFLAYALAVLATLLHGFFNWPLLAPASTLINVSVALFVGGLSIAFMEFSKQDAIRRAISLSLTDVLTGLSNRDAFDRALRQAVADAQTRNVSVALILCDIDRFKAINDEFGHAVGDEVLRDVGEVLNVQESPADCLARWGGEEFAMIVLRTDLEGARLLAESLRRRIAAHRFEPVGQVTASFGVAVWRRGWSADEFFSAVDAAMYRAKSGGRNRVETAQPRRA